MIETILTVIASSLIVGITIAVYLSRVCVEIDEEDLQCDDYFNEKYNTQFPNLTA